MTKMEVNKMTWNAIIKNEKKASVILHKNLLDMHCALHSRALMDEYPFHPKTFRMYKKIQLALARDYCEMCFLDDAKRYRMNIIRTMRKLEKKKGEK